MTDERFNELLAGPLYHPMVPFTITRLALALRHVIEATGEQGEAALEAHCAALEKQDESGDETGFSYDDGSDGTDGIEPYSDAEYNGL